MRSSTRKYLRGISSDQEGPHLSQMRRFLGIVNDYHHFLNESTNISQPENCRVKIYGGGLGGSSDDLITRIGWFEETPRRPTHSSYT